MFEVRLYNWVETREFFMGQTMVVNETTSSWDLGTFPTMGEAHDEALRQAIAYEFIGMHVELKPWGWEYRHSVNQYGEVHGMSVECLPVQ